MYIVLCLTWAAKLHVMAPVCGCLPISHQVWRVINPQTMRIFLSAHVASCWANTEHTVLFMFLPPLQLALAPLPPLIQPFPRIQLGTALTLQAAASAQPSATVATLLSLALAGPPLARLAPGALLLLMGLMTSSLASPTVSI
jgi:hypothetical protein